MIIIIWIVINHPPMQDILFHDLCTAGFKAFQNPNGGSWYKSNSFDKWCSLLIIKLQCLNTLFFCLLISSSEPFHEEKCSRHCFIPLVSLLSRFKILEKSKGGFQHKRLTGALILARCPYYAYFLALKLASVHGQTYAWLGLYFCDYYS